MPPAAPAGGCFFPNWIEPRRRVDKALYAVVMEAYTGGISKSEVSRICQGLDEQVKAFLQRPLDHARFPYVYLDATYLHGRLGRNMQVVSRAGWWPSASTPSATARCWGSP